MIYKIKTNYPIEVIKAELDEQAKQVGFGVLGSYEFKKILKSKGFELEKDITVYELCNPAAAQVALRAEPEVSVYLPCRLSLYEEDGEITLATINIDDIISSTRLDKELQLYLHDIFDNMKKLMKHWEEKL